MTIVTSVDFTAKPTRNKVKVALAGGLTAQTAAQKVRVTVDGETRARRGGARRPAEP